MAWLLAAFLALPAGQAFAYATQGDGFAWPGPHLGESLMGLLQGRVGEGLPPRLMSSAPPAALVYLAVFAVELALAAIAMVGLSWWWRTVGPLAQIGLATRREVAAVLGRSHLGRRRRTIRPDLSKGRSA